MQEGGGALLQPPDVIMQVSGYLSVAAFLLSGKQLLPNQSLSGANPLTKKGFNFEFSLFYSSLFSEQELSVARPNFGKCKVEVCTVVV